VMSTNSHVATVASVLVSISSREAHDNVRTSALK